MKGLKVILYRRAHALLRLMGGRADESSGGHWWAVLFVGTHVLISSNLIRPFLVRRFGEQVFRGVYSVVAWQHSFRYLWFSASTDTPVRCSGICAVPVRFVDLPGC